MNDVVTEQSAWGRLLKFGDIEIISGSESGIDVFQHLADPIKFNKALFDQREALGGPGLLEERSRAMLTADAPSADDIPGLIVELDKLRQKGLITDAEFKDKRTQLLSKI